MHDGIEVDHAEFALNKQLTKGLRESGQQLGTIK
jgi:hypothetical protein